MQELEETTFYYYPKKQNLCIIYSDKTILKSRLFKALSNQVSPKNGFLLRLRKSNLGHFLSTFLPTESAKFSVPKNSNIKVGYVNNNKTIFFSLSEEGVIGKNIYRKLEKNNFNKTPFLGYSILEEYTKKEYFLKRNFIIKALKKRWIEIIKTNKIHGDFTHFNILINSDNEISFIDEKKCENSILFDHFYFYSYLLQCLTKCKTISKKAVLELKSDLQLILKNSLKTDNKVDFKHQLQTLNLEAAVGIHPLNREFYLEEFKMIFKK